MTDVTEQVRPSPTMVAFDRLVGTWEVSGGVIGRMTYEWLPGGHFLMQTVYKVEHGQTVEGIDIIGHLRPWRGMPSEEVISRFFDNEGNTLDYVYELEDDTLTIWAGSRGSKAYYEGHFNEDSTVVTGRWHFPASGGYDSVMTKVLQ
jgi:hypothetical protein